MRITIIRDIAEVPAEQFGLLDSRAGASGCYERVRQHQGNGQWSCSYLYGADEGKAKALIPFYVPRGTSWPYPAYDPSGWALPGGVVPEAGADKWVVVGCHFDLRAGWPVAPDVLDPAQLRRLLAPIAAAAAEQGRGLLFPYMYGGARQAVSAACGDAVAWSTLGQEAQLRGGVSEPGWESRLDRRARHNLRRDRRLVAESGHHATVHAWSAVEEEAAGLIAAHNVRKGAPDHPEFVKLRARQWDKCPGLEYFVLLTRSGDSTGVLTGCVWRDELDMHEVGLSGEPGPRRLAAYLELGFLAPLRLAQDRGLRRIRLGLEASSVKEGRGCEFESLNGGVLDAERTRELARDGG